MVTGGLTAAALAGTVALAAKDQIVAVATQSQGGSDDSGGLSLRGNL